MKEHVQSSYADGEACGELVGLRTLERAAAMTSDQACHSASLPDCCDRSILVSAVFRCLRLRVSAEVVHLPV